MSESKKKIAELHKQTKIEKKAKMDMYRIATDAIKTYLSVIGYAGRLVDRIQKLFEEHIHNHHNFETSILNDYGDFWAYEKDTHKISFREYVERRQSGKILDYIIKKLFKESYKKRYDDEHKKIQEHTDRLLTNESSYALGYTTKEITKFHIMQDIVTEQKKPEAFILQKYGLQKDELLVIIEEIKKDLQGIKVESDNVTVPTEQEHKS